MHRKKAISGVQCTEKKRSRVCMKILKNSCLIDDYVLYYICTEFEVQKQLSNTEINFKFLILFNSLIHMKKSVFRKYNTERR